MLLSNILDDGRHQFFTGWVSDLFAYLFYGPDFSILPDNSILNILQNTSFENFRHRFNHSRAVVWMNIGKESFGRRRQRLRLDAVQCINVI